MSEFNLRGLRRVTGFGDFPVYEEPALADELRDVMKRVAEACGIGYPIEAGGAYVFYLDDRLISLVPIGFTASESLNDNPTPDPYLYRDGVGEDQRRGA